MSYKTLKDLVPYYRDQTLAGATNCLHLTDPDSTSRNLKWSCHEDQDSGRMIYTFNDREKYSVAGGDFFDEFVRFAAYVLSPTDVAVALQTATPSAAAAEPTRRRVQAI